MMSPHQSLSMQNNKKSRNNKFKTPPCSLRRLTYPDGGSVAVPRSVGSVGGVGVGGETGVGGVNVGGVGVTAGAGIDMDMLIDCN